MKRIIAILSVALLVLVGCTETEDTDKTQVEKKLSDDKEEAVNTTLTSDAANFHFVVDWLSNTEILYVEKEGDLYFVKSFNITTGETEVLYEDLAIIVNVLVHSSKEKLLIHTTDNPTTGMVKVISLDGAVEHEVVIESAELEIEWNDIDPSLILLTAFHEDWTYDVFLYDGMKEDLHLLSFESPFPKWLGTEKIVVADLTSDPLGGGKFSLYDWLSGKRQQANFDGVIHYDTYQESLLLMQINEAGKAAYTILDQDLSTQSNWTMPAVKSYEEWSIPQVGWLAKDHLIIASNQSEASEEGYEEPYQLTEVIQGEQALIVDEVAAGPVSCSPDGEKCLTGYAFEKYIDLKIKEEITWLEIID